MNTPASSVGFPRATASTLAQLAHGEEVTVFGLATVPGFLTAETDGLLARLRDLGFVAGARCKVVARMWPGGDPIAVRIAGSTFALRRAEAAAVLLAR